MSSHTNHETGACKNAATMGGVIHNDRSVLHRNHSRKPERKQLPEIKNQFENDQDGTLSKILLKLERIEKVMAAISTSKGKQWVRATEIKKVTGWNNKQMERARLNGYVDYKKGTNGMYYDINSIHPLMIK